MTKIVFSLSFFLFLCLFQRFLSLSTTAVDLGCAFFKIGIARPSLSISIAPDQLGRKLIPSALYIKNNKIIFGWEAFNMLSYDPSNVFLHVPCLIGKKFHDDYVQVYLRQFPYYNLKEDSFTKSLYYINFKNETYFIDELLALLLDNVMKLANEGIKRMYPNRYFSNIAFNPRTTVITIPSGFKQKEKIIILRTCEMVNITVLQLLESNTAALIAMTSNYLKIKKEEGIFGIMDIGFEHIQMSIANIRKVQSEFKGYSFSTYRIEMISSSFLSNVGISKILYAMQNYFLKIITKKIQSNNVIDHPIFLSKLYMGCEKLLRRLSVSEYAHVVVKGIVNGSDFKLSLNSSEFLIIINKTLEGVQNIIKTTFKNLKEFWNIPNHLVIIGGGRYLPYIDYTIKNTLKGVPILKILDPYFSVVWGATYQSTNIAPGFFNFPILLSNKTFRSTIIQIEVNNLRKEKKMTFILQKSSLIFSWLLRKIKNNFNFYTYYKPLALEGNPNMHLKSLEPILVHNVYVHNVEESIKQINSLSKMEFKDMDPPTHTFKGIEIIYSCDINSVISLESVSVLFAKRSFFNITTLENAEDLLNTSNRIIIEDVKLELVYVKLNYTVVPPYEVITEERLKQMTIKIVTLKLKSKEYFEKEAVRNELQFYVTDMKRKFNERDYIICTDDMEKVKIWSFLDDTSRWIKSYITQEINKEEYFYKFDYLLNLTYKIDIRVHEIRNRPLLLKRLKQLLETTQHFIMNMFVTSGSGQSSKGIFTKNETKDLRMLNKDIRMWLLNFTDKFKTILPNDDPPILCNQIIEKIILLETDHNRLLALMEKRTDPNEKDNKRSDQTLIEQSGSEDDVKNKELNQTVTEVNNVPYQEGRMSSDKDKKEESQCGKQVKDEGDLALGTSEKSCTKS